MSAYACRYFAETSATLFTTILGQREGLDALGGPFRDYWLSDGTYGSFRIQVAVDGLEPTYSVLRSPLLPDLVDETCAEGGPVLLPCRLWGNSDRDGDVSGGVQCLFACHSSGPGGMLTGLLGVT